jgi:hypothetical protein
MKFDIRNLIAPAVGAAILAGLYIQPANALNYLTITKVGAGTAGATTSIKTTPITLYGVAADNLGIAGSAYGGSGFAGPYYLQLFNKKAAVVGTTTPLLELSTAASSTVQLFNPPIPLGGDSANIAITTTSQGSATASGNIYLIYQ